MSRSDGERRLFTLEEANALVPRVRELLLAIQGGAERLSALQRRLESLREQKRRGEHMVASEAKLVASVMGDANRETDRLRSLLADLQAIGCEVKDIHLGLVDFPAQRDERIVYLCWKLGEGAIGFWHELDTGFTGRQPL